MSEPEPSTAPPGPVLDMVRNVFEEVLGVATVGGGENFFALGGDSLLALHATALIEEQLPCEIPLDVIFDHPSINALSDCLMAILTGASPDP